MKMSARMLFVGLLAACSLQAFANEPKGEGEDAASSESTPEKTQAAADVVEEGESKPITEEDIDRFLKRQGYTPVKIKGVMHYCRNEAPMGSRVKKSTCITGERAKELRQNAKEEMRRIDQRMWSEGM
jgi:hypothetical protein